MKKYSRPGEHDYVQAAERALEIDDNDAAQLLLAEALKRNDKNGNAYYQRGRLRYNVVAGADDAAMEDLKRAIALGAGGADAYRFLARIYDSKKQPKKAIEMLDKAIELYPDDHDSYKYRATICLGCGQKDKARKDYDKMLEVEPLDSQVYFRRAELLETMKLNDDAIADYKKVIQLDKPDALSLKSVAYKKLAALSSQAGKHDVAIDLLGQALKDDQSDDEFYKLRGQEYMLLNKYELAMADFNKSIEMAGEFSRANLQARAEAYEKLGKHELAAKDRKQAQVLDNKPAEKPIFQME